MATHASALHRAPALFLQIATEFATVDSMFLPRSRSDRSQKRSSLFCDGSIKAGTFWKDNSESDAHYFSVWSNEITHSTSPALSSTRISPRPNFARAVA